jgi:hypothetical protein
LLTVLRAMATVTVEDYNLQLFRIELHPTGSTEYQVTELVVNLVRIVIFKLLADRRTHLPIRATATRLKWLE